MRRPHLRILRHLLLLIALAAIAFGGSFTCRFGDDNGLPVTRHAND